jgi:transcriptional antiterminator RfaH
MSNLPRFALSAKAQEWMDLAPELVSQFKEVPQVNHEPPETFEGLTWFVVVCNPKCERRAQLGLRRAGYQTYLPQTKRWVVHARKKEERESPLFPRYLFVGLRGYGQDNGQDTYRMDGVQGVESIVRNESRRPVQIPPTLLARLLEREQAGEFDFTRLPDAGPQYRPGEVVRLTAGAFNDLTAEVTAMLSKGRVEVLLSFMGRGTKVRIKSTELQRLEAAE